MCKVNEKFREVVELCDGKSFIHEIATGYAEPGCIDPETAVVTGNWNKDTDSLLWKLTALGCSCEWLDEWVSCEACGKLVRTSPCGADWKPSYLQNEGVLLCHNCLRGDVPTAIKMLVGNPRVALTFDLPLGDHGFIKLDATYEHGMYGGQNDDPKKIYASLKAQGIDRVIFQTDESSPFDIHFSVWVDKAQFDASPLASATDPAAVVQSKADVDPAVVLGNFLRGGTIAESGQASVVDPSDSEEEPERFDGQS